jgi:ubiquinone/menaquinone biosynthesis C-methylase UbiE
MPFPSSTFDTVLTSQMLEHVLRPASCLKEIARVLKPNGLLILTVPQQNELHSEPNDFWRFTKHGMVYLLEESGFEIVRLIQRGGFFSCVAQSFIRVGIDTFHPFSNRLAMKLMGPFTKLLTLIAINLDEKIRTEATRRHALGWCILARKK